MTFRGVGPSVWIASDGAAGNEKQAMAIAHALGEMQRWSRLAHIQGTAAPRTEPIRLQPKGWQTLLRVDQWVFPKSTLSKAQRAVFQPPWPDLWVGAGRRTAAFSLKMRKWSGGKTFVIHMLNPKCDPSGFDMLIVPLHDNLTGENVMASLGTPVYYTPEDIEAVEHYFGFMADEPGMKIAIALGGDSNTHKMTPKICHGLATLFRRLASKGYRLRICCSRRTPLHACTLLRTVADEIGASYWDNPEDGRNPYLANLLFSDIALVTEDSASMISDAAYFGLPIHLIPLQGGSDKFKRLHKAFIDCGAARWIGDGIGHWRYEPVREIDRIADILTEKLLARYPSDKVVLPESSPIFHAR